MTEQVTLTVKNVDDSTAGAGSVVFTPVDGDAAPIPVIRDTAGHVLLTGAVHADLNEVGEISRDLLATDDPDLDPTGFTWRAVIQLHDGTTKTVLFELPAGAGPVELADVASVDPAAPSFLTNDGIVTQLIKGPSQAAKALNAAIGASLPAVAHPPRPRITWIETFQVGHGWTNPLPSGSLTDDPAEFVIGTQSLKITDGAAQRQGLTVDLTAAMPVVMLREDAMPANGSIVLYAATDSTFANYYQWTIEGSADGSRWFREDEWVLVTLPLSDAAVIGAPTPAGVTLLRIRASGNAGVTFHANGIGTTPEAASTARLSITMDDGYDDWLTVAREHLTPRGLAATGFLIPDLVGSPGFLSTDQIGELSRNHGWDFEAHGADVYVGMTQEQMRSEWSTTKAWFVAQGLRPPSHLAYVGGQNDALVAKTAREFFATARTISARQAETVPPGDPMRLRAVSSIGFSASANVAAINAAIDKAITGGTHLILVFHQFVDGAPTVGTQCSWTDFDSILDHAIASGIEIDTIAGFFG